LTTAVANTTVPAIVLIVNPGAVVNPPAATGTGSANVTG